MIAGIVDTNILIELYRKLPAAQTWLATQTDVTITPITWFEFMEGARGTAGQLTCLHILSSFEIVFLTEVDQQWVMKQLLKYRLSHGVSFKDCLIASVCSRLQVPLYTKNVKDFLPILDAKLVIKPY
jgi:predicted nucleic acid-binding protein